MTDISSVVPVIGMGGSNGAGIGITPLDDGINPLAGPGTDFKAVAIGVGPNLEALPAYFDDPLLQTGNLPGLAMSAFNNRALRQGTFVASSLCQWMSGQINQYIPDDGSQIGWISEWQSALGSFVTALIPPAPNLGAYLPLAGGTMVGHIRFQSGVSVILANNTWYYALDTGGTSRGLIIKGSDNNVYVNDGSAGYVFIQGEPTANNNFFWCGRDTAGAVRGVVGLLSDNQIHLGDNARAIYFDCGGASAWCSSNIVIPNNYYYYCKATDGNNRAVLGINSGNSLLIGGSAPADTNIYGNPIYMRNNTYALGILQVNGFAYLQGGARSYIPGGNDPHQIYADQGYYARHHYTVGGIRDWTCGCLNSGVFAIADESAAAIRFEIDTGGGVSFYNAAYVGGGLTVYNGLYVATGTLTCGLLNCNAGMNVSGSLNVWSGGLYVASGDLTVNANINCGGSISAGYYHSTGNIIADNTVQAGYIHSTWDMRADHDITAGNQVVAGYFYSYGSGQFNGALGVNGSVSVGGDIGAGGNIYGNTLYVNGISTGGTITGGYIHANGNFRCEGWSQFIAGGEVWNGFTVQSGNLNVNASLNVAGTISGGYIHANGNFRCEGWSQFMQGAEVWNTFTVQSGNLNVNASLNVGNYTTSAYVRAGQLQIGGLGYMYDNGGNYLIMPFNANITGSLQVNNNSNVSGSASVNGNFNVGGIVGFNNDLTVNGNFGCNGAISMTNGGAHSYIGGTLEMGNSIIIDNNIYPSSNGNNECGVCQHQWRNVFSYNFITESDPEKKRDIAPVPEVCLELVNAIRPSTFKWRDPGTMDDHGRPMTEDHPYANTHWGFMQPDVMSVMNDPDRGLPVFGGAYIDHVPHGDDVKLLQYNELVAVLWQAVRELSDKVDQLQATKH